jgi:dihydrodipicolinate reductase
MSNDSSAPFRATDPAKKAGEGWERSSGGMKLILIGYGKMGKTIEEIALQRGHTIVLTIDQPNLHEFTRENMAKADAAIEFTGPHSAYENVKTCIEWGARYPVLRAGQKD